MILEFFSDLNYYVIQEIDSPVIFSFAYSQVCRIYQSISTNAIANTLIEVTFHMNSVL